MSKELRFVQVRVCTIQTMRDMEPEEIAEAMWALAEYLEDGEADEHLPLCRGARLIYRHMLDDVERGRELTAAKRKAARKRWDKTGKPPGQPMLPEQCGFITDADAAQMARDQSDVIEEAKRSGFRMIPAEEDQLIDLLSRYGKEKVLTALGEAVRHNAASLAYVAKVLEGIRREEARKDDKPPELTQTMKFN